MPRAWTITAVLALALGPVEAAAACLRYDAPEQLAGTLTRRPVPGTKGTQTYWYLRLDRPACVEAKSANDGVNAARDAIREIQLTLPVTVSSRFVSLPDTRVVAAGTLFGAHPGPHATAVMMTVREMRKADPR